LLGEFNATAQAVKPASIPELFASQAQRTPDAVAVVCGAEQVSYRGLEEGSNRVAHYLIGLGVGSETVVGLCLARSRAMLIVMLGIVKGGGAYLPLAPPYPGERLCFMLADARARLVLTDKSLRDRLAGAQATQACRLVCMEAAAAAIAAQPTGAPVLRLDPAN